MLFNSSLYPVATFAIEDDIEIVDEYDDLIVEEDYEEYKIVDFIDFDESGTRAYQYMETYDNFPSTLNVLLDSGEIAEVNVSWIYWGKSSDYGIEYDVFIASIDDDKYLLSEKSQEQYDNGEFVFPYINVEIVYDEIDNEYIYDEYEYENFEEINNYKSLTSFAIYDNTDKSLSFFQRETVPNIGETYKYNDENGNTISKKVSAIYSDIDISIYATEDAAPWSEYRDKIKSVNFIDEITPTDTAYWFYKFENCEKFNLNNLNVSNVIDMSYMFSYAGYNSDAFNIGNLNNWDVSNVSNMCEMFSYAGQKSTTWNIGDLSSWDVSNVTNMKGMFNNAGNNTDTWLIGDLSNWEVSNVTDMSFMFSWAGHKISNFSIGDLSGWDVSSVTDMQEMFASAGQKATTWSVGDLSRWNVANVTNMKSMFSNSGYNSSTFNIGNLNNWNVSKVTDMSYMFHGTGFMASSWNIGDLSSWDVSNVEDMSFMFSYIGNNASVFDIGNLTNWNVSNVKNMESMFAYSGFSAATWNIGDLSNWNTSNVEDTNLMFFYAGYSTQNWDIGDLSNWDLGNVKNASYMFYYAGPMASEWNIGDLSEWNTQNVTDMSYMFSGSGCYSGKWNIGNISKWNVYNVKNTSFMFYQAGYMAQNVFEIDLSEWNASNINDMSYMFGYAGEPTLNVIKLPQNISNSTKIDGITTKTFYDITDNNKEYAAGQIPLGNENSHILKINHKITFDHNNEDSINQSEQTFLTIRAGTKIGTLPEPKKDGYIFKGWYTEKINGRKITSNEIPMDDCIYYAQWEFNEHFTITIPKQLVLDDNFKCKYQIKIEGIINPIHKINVIPDESFVMKNSSNPDEIAIATIIQDRTKWESSECEIIGNGVLTSEELNCGEWNGSFNFKLELENIEDI